MTGAPPDAAEHDRRAADAAEHRPGLPLDAAEHDRCARDRTATWHGEEHVVGTGGDSLRPECGDGPADLDLGLEDHDGPEA